MNKFFSIILTVIVLSALILTNCNKDEPAPDISVKVLKTDPQCDSCSDGNIKLEISGGTPPYTVEWSNSMKGVEIGLLPEGVYIYHLKDSEDKQLSDTVKLWYNFELVNITTDFGEILIWLYPETPKHHANFLKLTKENFYTNLIFHRVVNDFVIQGGDPEGTGFGGPGYKIDAEFVSTIKHDFGAVGAARDNNPAKQSNGSQFYIVENPAGSHHLNNNYTVFGFVISGMTSVSAIADVPVNAQNRPLTDVVMRKVEVKTFNRQELLINFGFTAP